MTILEIETEHGVFRVGQRVRCRMSHGEITGVLESMDVEQDDGRPYIEVVVLDENTLTGLRKYREATDLRALTVTQDAG